MEALRENEEYREVWEHSESTGNPDLFSSFLDYHGFNTPPEISPFEFLKTLLIEKGELSVEEVVVLLTNISNCFYGEIPGG
jgi:hypothetical protein